MSDSSYLLSMRRESIRAFFDASPTAKLLRSDHAPFIIDFFHHVFKRSEKISIGLSDLRAKLLLYQEELHSSDPQLLTGAAERYLTQWADAGWLQRFLEASSTEPQFQLTRHSEEAIRFVDSILSRNQSLVGTESRLRLIIETLEDIVRGSSADPDRRLDYLLRQREAIDAEIEAIKSGKSVRIYRPAQLRERFQTAMELLKQLQSDFRAVEERFQEIAKDVQQLQATGSASRGGILGFALDSEELLKTQDQGISFFAFVAFLFSPNQQSALMKSIEEIQTLAPLADQRESLARVRRMVPSLLAEAEKVMKTTARLSTTLRRLLDSRSAPHRLRLSSVLKDIRTAAVQLKGDPGESDLQLSVETELELSSPMARTFWTAPQTFQSEAAVEHPINLDQAKQIASMLAKLERLDMKKLRGNIRELCLSGSPTTFKDLTELHPIRGGVVELLGYLQIAHDDGHNIDAVLVDHITIHRRRDTKPMTVTLPRITFNPHSSIPNFLRKPK